MKKFTALLLVTLLILGCLTGCTKESAGEPGQQQSEEELKQQMPKEESEKEPVSEAAPKRVRDPEKFRVIDYEDPRWFENAHLQDLDVDWPTIYLDDLSSGEAMIERGDWYFNKLFQDTSVTDVMLCCFEQISYIPSETMEWVHEKVAKAQRSTLPGYESVYELYQDFYKSIQSFGLDWYQYAIDACKEAGVRPWIYLRMNDHHNIGDPNSPYHEKFYSTAAKKGYLIGHEEDYGSGAYAYDFSEKEVRNWMLAYIEEVLNRYDAFGLQLDFVREICCFDYLRNPDCTEIMTGFIRDVRNLLDKAEKIHGHPMKLMIRLGSSSEHDRVYGFDVAEWVSEDLIDAVVPSPHLFLDSGIPVAEWKELVGEDIAVFPGMEAYLLQSTFNTKAAHIKGLCAGYFDQGADGIYFNNFYQLGSEGPQVYGIDWSNVEDGVRSYVVTCGDYAPKGGYRPYDPLPLMLNGKSKELTVQMGSVREGEYVYVQVGYTHSKALTTSLTVNGIEPCEVITEKIKDGDVSGWRFAANGDKSPVNTLLRYRFDGVGPTDELHLEFAENDGSCRVESVCVTVRTFTVP